MSETDLKHYVAFLKSMGCAPEDAEFEQRGRVLVRVK